MRQMMEEPDKIPEALAKYPGYLLSRLGEQARKRFGRAIAAEGMHPRQFGVMAVVASRPGITQQQLHELTGIDPSSMVAVIDELEAADLAERRPHPEDRRARSIHLTVHGEQTLTRVREVAAELQRELFAPLSAQERETLHELLRKLASAPDAHAAESPCRQGPAA